MHQALRLFTLASCIIVCLSEVNNTAADLYRISDIQPAVYHLHFTPYFDNFTFYGSATLTFNVTKNVQEIKLNSLDLIVYTTTLKYEGVEVPSSFKIDEEYERLILTGQSAFTPGTYSLKVTYQGILRNNTYLGGFYYGSHNVDGKLTYYGTTQMEAMDARRAFPCFDEPGLRAKFMVHIARYANQSTISNMPLMSSKPVEGTDRVWDAYKMSPRMPAYLVAFFVGQFSKISSNDSFYSVYARPDAIDQGQYLLSLMGTVVDTLSNFLQVPYTLPKLDIVAVPDFRAGAMENWGMNIFRESYALFKEGVSSELYRDYILQLLSHEFGHQWFGNLITTEWWGNIWLNEGFAAYLQHTISHLIKPSWRYDEAFCLRTVHIALEADEDDTHPITYTAYKRADTKFDSISYKKAASVLKMVEHTVSLDVFKKALNTYLVKTNASGGVAYPSLLFDAFETTLQNNPNKFNADFTFTTFFESWTLQEGFPLVTVKINDGSAVITQERYSGNGTTYNAAWYIPLTYTTELEKDFSSVAAKAWITPSQKSVQITLPPDCGWVIFNIRQSGFYRVNYDQDNWNILIRHLKQNLTQISAVNRAQLIDDAFHLASAGYIQYSTLFSLVDYLRNEIDYIPWQAAMKNFKSLLWHFEDSDLGKQLKAYVADLYSTYYNYVVTASSPDHVTLLGRIDALQFACDLGYAPCISRTSLMFKMWLSSEMYFPPEMKIGALCTGLRQDPSQALHVYQKLKDSNVMGDKVDFLKALACTSDPFLLMHIMMQAFLDETQTDIRAQHKANFFSDIVQKNENVEIVINFVVTYYTQLLNTLGDNTMKNILSILKKHIITDSQIEMVESAMKIEDAHESLREYLKSTVTAANVQHDWRHSHFTEVTNALATVSKQASPSSTSTLHISIVTTLVAVALSILL